MIRRALVLWSSRESDELLHANLMALQGAVPADTQVVVLVGGPGEQSAGLQQRLIAQAPAFALSLWHIPHGDKANAWNQYVQGIWQGEAMAFFLDGHATLPPEAMPRLAAAVAAGGDHVLGGTGVPPVGRHGRVGREGREGREAREQLLREGGVDGTFCCLKGETIAAMRARGLRLPVGLCRADAVMGALLGFGLRPEMNGWDPSRIAVCADATWQVPHRPWWRLEDVRGRFRRMLRPGRARIESAALKYFLATRRQPFESLPATAKALALAWLVRSPQEAQALLRASAINRRGWRELVEQPDPEPGELVPRLIWRYEASHRR